MIDPPIAIATMTTKTISVIIIHYNIQAKRILKTWLYDYNLTMFFNKTLFFKPGDKVIGRLKVINEYVTSCQQQILR